MRESVSGFIWAMGIIIVVTFVFLYEHAVI